MSRRTTGWLFVAVQAVLLAGLILLPDRGDWSRPVWLATVGLVLILAGLAVVVIAALGLGPALTPNPVPAPRGELATGGLYRYVRHPIYTGVLAVVTGLAIRSGSWFAVGVALSILVFFDRKARWEETRLAERYPGYSDYAARTPRFVPQPWRAPG